MIAGRLAIRWAPALVALVALVTFLPAVRNGFVDFDDVSNFVTNPRYRGLGWTQVTWMFTTAHMGHYVPLTWITLGLDYLVWGMDPAGYHLTSIVLHATTAAVFYVVARRLIVTAFTPRDSCAVAVGALTAALIFAIHPLRVESVVWVTERRDVLSGLFYLATLLAWLRAIEREPMAGRWYWASLALFMCALLSKAIAVTLPLVLVVLDVYPLRRLGGPHGWWNRRARAMYAEKVPFILLAAGASVLALRSVRDVVANMPSPSEFGVGERLATSAFGLAFYLWKMLVPIHLSPLYDLPVPVNPLAFRYLVATGVVLGLSALGIVFRRRSPWFLCAWAVYIVTLLPVLGIFQNGPQSAADRYTYLACLPWSLVVGAVAALGLRLAAPGSRLALAALAMTVVATVTILALMTVDQIGVWRDSTTLWRHAARVDPSSAIAYNNLGSALWQAGKTDEAIEAFNHAMAPLPTSTPKVRATVSFNLAVAFQQRGDLAAAERYYRKSVELDASQARAWNNLGVIFAMQDKHDAAFRAFRNSLIVAPGNPDACANGRKAAVTMGRTLKELEQCHNPAKM